MTCRAQITAKGSQNLTRRAREVSARRHLPAGLLLRRELPRHGAVGGTGKVADLDDDLLRLLVLQADLLVRRAAVGAAVDRPVGVEQPEIPVAGAGRVRSVDDDAQ